MGAHRGRGRSGGKASRRREEPSGGLGWARGGLRRLLRGAEAPAAAVGGGGGGPASLGGDGWVGEHQRRPRKLATWSFGREGGWRRELRGDLRDGGGYGGRRCLFQVRGPAERGSCDQEGRRKGWGRLWVPKEDPRWSRARDRSRRGRSGRHGVVVAVRRPSSVSAPWIATRVEAEKLREKPGRSSWWHGEGAARGRRPRRPAQTGEGERGKERVERK